MRVLLFSNWFPPVLSGSSFYTSSLAQALAAEGVEVTVVTLDWGADYAPAAGLPFPVHRLPVFRLPRLPLFYNLRLMGMALSPANRRSLIELLRSSRSELLHHVNHIFDTTFLSLSAARAAGVPVVGSITTPIQHERPFKQALMTFADRVTVGRFGVCRWDGIVSLDHTVHEYVQRLYGPAAARRSVVIPFGVRIETLERYTEDQRGPAGDPTIVFVGHIHPFRNPAQLIRAMPRVLEAVPGARLILAGRVDLNEPVAAARELGLKEPQVTFLGETAHERVVELIRRAQVYASWSTGPFPSLGTAPMEAMLCGVPVLNDLPENLFGPGGLRQGENILLVDSKDAGSVAQGLVRLLTDPALRERIGAGGRRFVRERLDWGGIARQMIGFYGEIIAKRAAKGGRLRQPGCATPRSL